MGKIDEWMDKPITRRDVVNGNNATLALYGLTMLGLYGYYKYKKRKQAKRLEEHTNEPNE